MYRDWLFNPSAASLTETQRGKGLFPQGRDAEKDIWGVRFVSFVANEWLKCELFWGGCFAFPRIGNSVLSRDMFEFWKLPIVPEAMSK